MKNKYLTRWLVLAGIIIVFLVLILNMTLWENVFRILFPQLQQVIHPRGSLAVLLLEHIVLVGISSFFTILIGIPLGIWVTRESGRGFMPLVTSITSLGQTFPPVAVLALAVPALGFGVLPTVTALFLYGLLPVVRNTIAGLRDIPSEVLDASYGMGMSRWQTLTKVELPLAAPVIIAGIRISVIINIGTAMIGATIGAGGLGSPIIAGLIQNNMAYILGGAIPAAMLAILTDQLFINIEKSFVYTVKEP